MTPRPSETAIAPREGRWNLWFGLGTLVFAGLCLTVWFPRDIGSGFLQQNLTGRTVPGDAFFPVLLVGLMIPLALLLVLSQLRGGTPRGGEAVGRVSADNLLFLLRATLLVAAGLAVISWTGPLLVWLTNLAGLTAHSGYRAVSATFPYDVSGFFVGGTLLSAGFIHTARHTLRPRDVLIAALTTALLILIFDGLLENIQLPPNADL